MINSPKVWAVMCPGVDRILPAGFWSFPFVSLFIKWSKVYLDSRSVKPVDVFTFYTLLLFFLELKIRYFSKIKVNSKMIHYKCQDWKSCLYWCVLTSIYINTFFFFKLQAPDLENDTIPQRCVTFLQTQSSSCVRSSHPPTSSLFEETGLLSGLFHLYIVLLHCLAIP